MWVFCVYIYGTNRLNKMDGIGMDRLLSLNWMFAHFAFALVVAILNGLPFWVNNYVPMVLPYYQSIAMASFGLFVSLVNHYWTWKEVDSTLHGLFMATNVLSMATTILYFVEYTGLNNADKLYGGTYNMSFVASISGSSGMNVSVTSSSKPLELGYSFWNFTVFVEILILLVVFIDFCIGILIVVNGKTDDNKTETSKSEEVNPDPLKRHRMFVKKMKSVHQQELLYVTSCICLVLVFVDTILSFYLPLSSTFVPNQNQNTRSLVVFTILSCWCLPLPDLYCAKRYDEVSINETTPNLPVQDETDKKPDKKPDKKSVELKEDGIIAENAHIYVALHYNAAISKDQGLKTSAKNGFNQYVVLYFGYPGDNFSVVYAQVVWGILSMACLIINLVQQSNWLMGVNSLNSILITDRDSLINEVPLNLVFNVTSTKIVNVTYTNWDGTTNECTANAMLWLNYDSFMNIFGVFGSAVVVVLTSLYAYHGAKRGAYKNVMKKNIIKYLNTGSESWTGPSELGTFAADLRRMVNKIREDAWVISRYANNYNTDLTPDNKQLGSKRTTRFMSKVAWPAPI